MAGFFARLEKRLERLVRSSPALERLARGLHLRSLLHAACSHRQELVLGRRLGPDAATTATAVPTGFSILGRGEVEDVRGFFLAVNPGQVDSLAGLYDYGCRVLFMFVAGQPAGYIWYVDAQQERPLPELAQFRITLTGRDVYLFNFYVSPAARGSQQATKLLRLALGRLGAQRYEQAYGCVERGNVPARWLYSSTGWTSLREVSVWTFLSCLRFAGGRWFVNPKVLRPWRPSVPMFDYIPLAGAQAFRMEAPRLPAR